MTVYVGTSGWQYQSWRGRFYPKPLKQPEWLQYFAERFRTVEVNNTFYRLPERDVFEKWSERTPDDFVIAPKMSRYLTHIKRLREPEEPVARFLDRAEPLGRKLGPVLIQLPPQLGIETERLESLVHILPSRVRWAIEFRHASWFVDEVRDLLAESNIAFCLADRGSRPITPIWKTSDWGYVRFHGGTGSPESCYGRSALRGWVRRLGDLWTGDDDVFVYFNNDTGGCAVRDARVLAALVESAGYDPTRVPGPHEVSLDAGAIRDLPGGWQRSRRAS